MVRVVRLEFEPQYVDSFLTFFEDFHHEIVNFKGCRSLKLMRDSENEQVFFTISEWESVDDLNRYRKSSLFKEVWPGVKSWMSGKPLAYSLESFGHFS